MYQNDLHILSGGMNLKDMVLRYIEEETGRTIDMIEWTMEPLGYDDLVAIPPNQSVALPIQLRHAKLLDEHGSPVQPSQATVSFTLDSPFSSNVIALVDGGWLPMVWAARDRIILADRNVVTEIQSRFQEGKKRTDVRDDDFIDFLTKWPIRINPLLYTMEGNQQRHPTDEEAKAQILEAVQKIKRALPNATIEPDSVTGLPGIIGLIQDSIADMERKTQFLISVAPSLMAPASKDRRAAMWGWILAKADETGVPRRSLPVLAALSCLACQQALNPTKQLLKPSHHFDKKQAYNALCDLRALELFVYALAQFPELPATLCTKDRHMALFWTGLGIHNISLDQQKHPTFELQCDKLLPNVTSTEMASLLDGA